MKNFNLRKMFLFVCLLVISVFGINKVNAESVADSLTIKSYDYKNTPMSFPQTFHVKKTTTGKYSYCITYAKKTPSSGVKYTKDDIVDDRGKYYIMKEAEQHVNSYSDFFIYQTALWVYMYDRGMMEKSNSTTTFRKNLYNSNSSTANKIKSIVANAKNAPKIDKSAPTISLSTSNNELSLNGDNYVSSKIKFDSSTDNYKIGFYGAPSGTTYKLSNGYIYVYVPASSVKESKTSFNLIAVNYKKIYNSQNYKPSNSKYQKMAVTFVETKSANTYVNLIINKNVDKVIVSKQDITTKKELPGAKLQIKDSQNKVVDSWTSTSEAHEVKLEPGEYTLTETIAPEGYKLSTESISFSVTNKGVTNQVVMYNSKEEVKTVSISKQDITTKGELPGATLEVKDSTGKVIDSWVSASTPHEIANMKPGKYTLTEKIAPEGYELSTESVSFEVNENGEAVDKVVMYNTPKKVVRPQVNISKLDSSTKEYVSGATLEVKNSKGEVIETFVSEQSAHVIKDLEPGTYTLTETDAPDGYDLAESSVTFTVLEDSDEAVNVVMYNTKTVVSGEEIAVPSTGSFTTTISTLFGTIVLISGSVLIAKNLKKKNGI